MTKQVDVLYTLADIYAVTTKTWTRIVGRIALVFGVLIAVMLLLPVLLDGEPLRASAAYFPWSFFAGLIGLLVVFPFAVCPLFSFWRAKRQGNLGPNSITMHEDGVRLISPKGESLVYWSAVRRIAVSRSRLFLFISPSSAILLPSRAYDHQSEFEAATEYASSRGRNAK